MELDWVSVWYKHRAGLGFKDLFWIKEMLNKAPKRIGARWSVELEGFIASPSYHSEGAGAFEFYTKRIVFKLNSFDFC